MTKWSINGVGKSETIMLWCFAYKSQNMVEAFCALQLFSFGHFFFFYKLWFPQPLFFLEVNLVRKWVQFHAWGKNETMPSGAVGGSVQVYKNFSNQISRKFLFFQIYLKERVSKPVFFMMDQNFKSIPSLPIFCCRFLSHICIQPKILEIGEFKSIRKYNEAPSFEFLLSLVALESRY